jgi:hypothetical protein
MWAPPSNYSVKRTPVNRFRQSKRCGRRRLPQALGYLHMQRALSFVFLSALFVWSAVAMCVSTYQLLYFWSLSANFVVVSTHLKCEEPLNNRCVTHYVTRNAGGTSGELVPFGYEFEPGVLVVGSHIVKRGSSFSSEINEQRGLWPYLWQHIVVSLLGAVGLLLWYFNGGVKVLTWWLRGLIHPQKA